MPRWDLVITADTILMLVTADAGKSCASNALKIASANISLKSSLSISAAVTFDKDAEDENVIIVLVPLIGDNVGSTVGS